MADKKPKHVEKLISDAKKQQKPKPVPDATLAKRFRRRPKTEAPKAAEPKPPPTNVLRLISEALRKKGK